MILFRVTPASAFVAVAVMPPLRKVFEIIHSPHAANVVRCFRACNALKPLFLSMRSCQRLVLLTPVVHEKTSASVRANLDPKLTHRCPWHSIAYHAAPCRKELSSDAISKHMRTKSSC